MKKILIACILLGQQAWASKVALSSLSKRSQRDFNLSLIISEHRFQKHFISIYNIIQKDINALVTSDIKKEHGLISETVFRLESACRVAGINLAITLPISQTTFAQQLHELNNCRENFFQRTFPVHWKSIMENLASQIVILEASQQG